MKRTFAAAVAVAFIAQIASGTEPNETFATATVLSPGVLTVADSLTVNAAFPDTLLAVRDDFGQITEVDDDSSHLGSGTASEIDFVPAPTGSINFSITGVGDDTFIGDHSVSGEYKVYVDAYDFFGDLADSFSQTRTLVPGAVHEFSFNNSDWIGGDYDVYIDNALSLTSDVDFFTFTGLTPGATFAARTADPTTSNVDTLLGWFDSGGGLLASDDDGAGGNLSLIGGTVPAGGMLTFAVSGVGDNGFTGNHTEDGNYELRLQIQPASVQGDYNNNGTVDAADYALWRNGGPLLNEVADPGTVSPADYNEWRARFGKSSASTAAASHSIAAPNAPEPTSLILAAAGLSSILVIHRRAALRRVVVSPLSKGVPQRGF